MSAIPPIISTRPAAFGSRPISAAPTNRPAADVVTMNQAHSTHYSPPFFPDPQDMRECAARLGRRRKASLYIDPRQMTSIHNVTTTSARSYGDGSGGEMIRGQQVNLIFEVAGLCIGHLGTCTTNWIIPFRGDRPAGSGDGPNRAAYMPSGSTVCPTSPNACAPPWCCRCMASPPRCEEFMRLIGQQFQIDQRSERP